MGKKRRKLITQTEYDALKAKEQAQAEAEAAAKAQEEALAFDPENEAKNFSPIEEGEDALKFFAEDIERNDPQEESGALEEELLQGMRTDVYQDLRRPDFLEKDTEYDLNEMPKEEEQELTEKVSKSLQDYKKVMQKESEINSNLGEHKNKLVDHSNEMVEAYLNGARYAANKFPDKNADGRIRLSSQTESFLLRRTIEKNNSVEKVDVNTQARTFRQLMELPDAVLRSDERLGHITNRQRFSNLNTLYQTAKEHGKLTEEQNLALAEKMYQSMKKVSVSALKATISGGKYAAAREEQQEALRSLKAEIDAMKAKQNAVQEEGPQAESNNKSEPLLSNEEPAAGGKRKDVSKNKIDLKDLQKRAGKPKLPEKAYKADWGRESDSMAKNNSKSEVSRSIR